MAPLLNALGIVASDVARSLDFYSQVPGVV
jgi:hypothetical protein